jgi:hypothetical protein
MGGALVIRAPPRANGVAASSSKTPEQIEPDGRSVRPDWIQQNLFPYRCQ